MGIAAGNPVSAHVNLVRELGRGGMGTVWVGHDSRFDREVAVKFISPSLLEEHPDLVKRFAREAKAAAQLRSPHVVQIFDHGQTEQGVPYMVMELLEGESLADRIRLRGPQTAAETSVVISQVAKALGEAHRRGVVHRDIKPDNIFLLAVEDDELFVKVLDFGIAKRSTTLSGQAGLTATGSLLGTPEYMSPEQIMTAKEVGPRADLWAMAAVAYEMLTGRRAFSGEAIGAIIMAISTGKYEPVSAHGLPLEFDAWFARAFHSEPTQRFESTRELARSFAALCGRAPSSREARDSRQPSQPEAAVVVHAPTVQSELAPDGHGGELAAVPTAKTLPQGPAAAIPQTGPDTAPVLMSPPSSATGPTLGGAAASLPGAGGSGWCWGRWLAVGSVMVVGLIIVGVVASDRPEPSAAGEEDEDEDRAASVVASPGEVKIALASATVEVAGAGSATAAPEGMVLVAAGSFSMGCSAGDSGACRDNEQPVHTIELPGYYIDKLEVSVAKYAECVSVGACTTSNLTDFSRDDGKSFVRDGFCNWGRRGLEDHPMNCVDMDQAGAYCRWQNKRLPTEAEWEKAARGTDGRIYPWGNEEPSCDLVVYESDRGVPGCGRRSTWPVGSKPRGASPYGALDMAGNVWEWVADRYHPRYYGRSPAVSPTGPTTGLSYVRRGGAWVTSKSSSLRANNRGWNVMHNRGSNLGFRCARIAD